MLAFCVVSSMLLSGCKMESFKSPEKLLEKPITNEENNILYNEIRKQTPLDTSFILPKNATEVGRINRVDLDKDGREEVVAFKKRTNETQGLNNIYMYIFQYDGESIIPDSERIVRISGNNIKYANFIDLDNNGKKEIILQVSNRGFENLYIYKMDKNNFVKLAEYNTSKYSIRLNFFDYDKNGKYECLALLQDQLDYEAILSELVIKDGKIHFIENQRSKNVDNLDKMEIINGRVSKDIRGTVLVYPGLNGSIISQIIVYDEGKFVRALEDKNEKIKNPFAVRPVDINGDGIIDLPKMEFKYINNTQKESNVLSWYTWNGKLPDKSRLDLEEQIFYCYDYNFKINIPKSLRNKFVIDQKFEDDGGQFDLYAKVDEDTKEHLYRMVVRPRDAEEVDSKEKNGVPSEILYENEEYTYVCTGKDLKNLKKFKLNPDKIKKSFSLINK